MKSLSYPIDRLGMAPALRTFATSEAHMEQIAALIDDKSGRLARREQGTPWPPQAPGGSRPVRRRAGRHRFGPACRARLSAPTRRTV